MNEPVIRIISVDDCPKGIVIDDAMFLAGAEEIFASDLAEVFRYLGFNVSILAPRGQIAEDEYVNLVLPGPSCPN